MGTRRKMRTIPLSHELLRSRITYDPMTGECFWRYCPEKRSQWNGQYAHKPAGLHKNRDGYGTISIDGVRLLTHRVIYFYVTGNEPVEYIDHIDGNPGNNAWANLRLASHAENMRNRRMHRNNKCGHMGVTKVRKTGRFRAEIQHAGVRHELGSYNDPDTAAAVYAAAAAKLHGGFVRATAALRDAVRSGSRPGGVRE